MSNTKEFGSLTFEQLSSNQRQIALIEQIGSSFNYYKTTIESLIQFIETEINLPDNGDDLDDINNTLDDLQNALDDLNNVQLPLLEDELDNLNNVIIPGLQQDLNNLQNELDQLDIDLGNLSDDLDNLNNVTLPGLQDDLDDLNNNVLPTLQGNLDDLDDILGNPPDSATFFSSIVTNQAWIDELVANQGWFDNLFANNLFADKITANEIATDAVTANEIAANSITANEILAGSITANEIAAGTITANEIAADEITTNQLNVGQIVGNQAFLDSLVVNTLFVDTLVGYNLFANELVANTVFTNALAANEIFTGELLVQTDIATEDWVQQQIASGTGEGNVIIRSDTEPSTRPNGDPLLSGDLWIDTTNGKDLPYTWSQSSTEWVRMYTLIDGGDITTGTVNAQYIDVAGVITAGSIISQGDNISELTNDAGYVSEVEFDGNFVIRSNTVPTLRNNGDPIEEGDIWIDTTNDFDLPHTYDGRDPFDVDGWIRSYTSIDGGFIRTGEIHTDRLNVDDIITVGGLVKEEDLPDVGNFIMRSSTAPLDRTDGTNLQVGDIWIKTNEGDLPYTWTGSSWQRSYTQIDGGNLIAGTVTADEINIGGIKELDNDAALVADIITDYSELNGLPTLGDVAALDNITSTFISNGAIITSKIAAGAIVTDRLAANAVTTTKIESGSITTSRLAANAVTADKASFQDLSAVAASIAGWNISSNRLVKDKVRLGNSPSQLIAGEGLWLGDLWQSSNESAAIMMHNAATLNSWIIGGGKNIGGSSGVTGMFIGYRDMLDTPTSSVADWNGLGFILQNDDNIIMKVDENGAVFQNAEIKDLIITGEITNETNDFTVNENGFSVVDMGLNFDKRKVYDLDGIGYLGIYAGNIILGKQSGSALVTSPYIRMNTSTGQMQLMSADSYQLNPSGIPTSDPNVAGRLWRNSTNGALFIS
jgi:archaellum component FlaC